VSILSLLAAAAIVQCVAIDGDTLRCGSEKVRLAGIDAPDRHCRRGRRCVKGDWMASRDALTAAIGGRPVTLEQTGIDPYGRSIAWARVGPIDLSCAQIAARQAHRVRRWDPGKRLTKCYSPSR
jgi:micrococcal nuclease